MMRAWPWIVVLAVWLVAMGARGEQAARIAVIQDDSADQRISGRLRAELQTLGLEVVDVPLAVEEPPLALDVAAKRVGAFAGVQVVPARGGIDVWVADPKTGATLLREFVTGPGRSVDDVVALQAVELLRARLGELQFTPKPPASGHSPPPPPPAVPSLPPPPDLPRLWLELGPGIAASPGGLGVTAHAALGLRWRVAPHFGVDVWGSLPITRASVEEREGSADVAPWLFGADASAWLFPPRANWQLAGAVGIGAAHLAIEGHAEPPFTSQTDSLTTALPFLRLSLERRLGARFALGLDSVVGLAIPRPAIRFSGREVAEWGRPVVLSVLSCGVALD